MTTALTSLAVKPAEAPGRSALAGMLLAIAAAAVIGFACTPAATSAAAISEAGPDLVRLMRGMALIKLALAAGAASAVLWRVSSAPIGGVWFAAYAAACTAMAAGPGLIWHMDFVRTGAVLLHGGLLAAVLLVWRDPAVGKRLAVIIAARRARLGVAPTRRP